MSKSQPATRAIFCSMLDSDIGDLIKMVCFAAVIKDCDANAADKIFDTANLDKSKMNRLSSGFLGPI